MKHWKLKVGLFLLFLVIIPGQGFCAAFVDGLSFESSEQVMPVNAIAQNNYKNVWFFDVIVKPEQKAVDITRFGISIHAGNPLKNGYEGMLMSQQNTYQVWVYIQHLQADQVPSHSVAELQALDIRRLTVSDLRMIPVGELSSQKDLFIAEFNQVHVQVNAGETVVLSFFGDFNPNMNYNDVIEGNNLLPLWSYSMEI